MNNYKTFIEISAEDLQTSILLYSNGKNPQALFSFQQSVEKAVKYLGLKDGIIQPNELERKISHKSNKIFRRAIIKTIPTTVYNAEHEIDRDFNELTQLVETVPFDKSVDLIIRNIIDIVENNPYLPFDIQSISNYKDLVAVLEKFEPDNSDLEKLKDIDNDIKFKPLADKMLIDFKVQLDNYLKGVMVLFCLNLLTEKLVSIVRYPDINTMKNPRFEFDDDHPLIVNLAALHQAQEFVIKTIN